MTHEEILKAAISKAVSNGFSLRKWWVREAPNTVNYVPADEELMLRDKYGFQWIVDHPYTIIFDKSFAKAFWGSKKMCIDCERHHSTFSDCDCGLGNTNPEWHIRLRQMVLEEDPISYLAKFI